MSAYRLRAPLLAACALVAGLSASSSRAAAQQQVEVTPFFTSYYAIAKLTEFTGDNGSTISERQANAPGLGARISYALPGPLALEGSVAYVWSGTRVDVEDRSGDPDAFNNSIGISGNLLYASGRLRFTPRRSNLYLLAGGGIVKRGGKTWDLQGEKQLTSPMGVLGAGIRAQVTPSFGLDVSAEVNLYNTDPDKSGEDYKGKFQQDVLITIGMPIRLGGR
ncbi:MAG TPA: outer membrane beta-barrel protein [Gemmatimonadaceae bacterium]|nr:outer membrane beta-barrel protein [Gemmatimonadaceae bacterium]